MVAVLCLCAASARGAAVSSISPAKLTFAAQAVDTASAPQVLTLTNTGDAVLNIVSVAITGSNFVDFSQTNTCGNTVAANGICSINVTFQPQAFGTRTANLFITSNATNSPQTVSLTGSGMGPSVSLSAPSLSFASQFVTTSGQQTLKLVSSGDQTLDISTIAVSGPFSENNTCLSSTLEPNQTCSINVFFTPVAGGPATGRLTIFDNAFPPQQIVPLSGIGADFSLALTPTTNSATAGQSAAYSLSVTPIGGFTGDVTLGCGGLPAGVSCTFAPSTVSVNSSSGATATVTVSTTAGSRLPFGYGSRPAHPGDLRLWWLPLAAAVFCGLAGLAGRRRKSKLLLGCATAAFIAALTVVACGGGTTSTTSVGTPPDTYRLVVTGTSPAGTTNVQNTVVLTIVVM